MRRRLLSVTGPGILVAATGVGAGDLLTASLAGSALGSVILWAVVVGAVFKWFLNEGIARWQLATGTTLLEGWVDWLGGWIKWLFLAYLLGWTFLTGGALVTACGVAGTALFPLCQNPDISKIYWGIIHSAVGVILVLFGGFRLFERLMSVCIAIMFVASVGTAFLTKPPVGPLLTGLLIPSIPPKGLGWILGVLGGVGGTVTLLSYGYWIREEGRRGLEDVKTCRIDLAVGYAMTALFGLSMVIIGSQIRVEGSGVRVAPLLADQLGAVLGYGGRLLFLLGFWGAVFSSLLGVWQSIPYLFSDFVRLLRHGAHRKTRTKDASKTRAYRAYLFTIAVVSLPVLWTSVKRAQLAYAVFGSLFMPLLALTLLIMNNREEWVGGRFRNRWLTNGVLLITLLFFLGIGASEALEKLAILL